MSSIWGLERYVPGYNPHCPAHARCQGGCHRDDHFVIGWMERKTRDGSSAADRRPADGPAGKKKGCSCERRPGQGEGRTTQERHEASKGRPSQVFMHYAFRRNLIIICECETIFCNLRSLASITLVRTISPRSIVRQHTKSSHYHPSIRTSFHHGASQSPLLPLFLKSLCKPTHRAAARPPIYQPHQEIRVDGWKEVDIGYETTLLLSYTGGEVDIGLETIKSGILTMKSASNNGRMMKNLHLPSYTTNNKSSSDITSHHRTSAKREHLPNILIIHW